MATRIRKFRVAIATSLLATGAPLFADGPNALPAVAMTPVALSEAVAEPVERTAYRHAQLESPTVAPTIPTFAQVSGTIPGPKVSKSAGPMPAPMSAPAWRWYGYGAANPFPTGMPGTPVYGADFPPPNVPVPANPELPAAKTDTPLQIKPPQAVVPNEAPVATTNIPTLEMPKAITPNVADGTPPLPTAAPALDLKLNLPPVPKPTPVLPAKDPWTSVPGAKAPAANADVAIGPWKPAVVRASGASLDTPRPR